MATKNLIVLAGPTASGKSSLALKLAQEFNLPILSSDSRQCYTEMSIGTAKPNLEERNLVPHYFIDSHSIQDEVNAGVFERYALDVLSKLFLKNRIVFMVGGTGLYIKALIEGLDKIPKVPKIVVAEIEKKFDQFGIEYLQNELKSKDPLYFEFNDRNNPHRMMRALAFFEKHGESIRKYQKSQKVIRNFAIHSYNLTVPREELYSKINARVDSMIGEGLENEVQSLLAYKELRSFKTVGYQEWLPFFHGEITKKECVSRIKQHTRNYAKRQVTWFKNQGNFEQLSVIDAEIQLSERINALLGQ